jgi:hypothetical protein
MRVLALDISTKAGWALMDDARLVDFGGIALNKTILEYGAYPWNYDDATEEMAAKLFDKIVHLLPDVVVIEESNLGKSRYAQKALEFIHKGLLSRLRGWRGKVIYLSSSSWRQALGLQMTKEDKRNNAKISKAKKKAAEWGMGIHEAKKALGVKGKINKKHIALRYVNETFGLKLKVKDNDAADAICLAAAFFKGAEPADGVM